MSAFCEKADNEDFKDNGEGYSYFIAAFFEIVIVKVFYDGFSLVIMSLANEALLIVFKCTIIVTGAMVFSDLCLKYFDGFINKTAELLNINNYSVIGLFLQMVLSVVVFLKWIQREKSSMVLSVWSEHMLLVLSWIIFPVLFLILML